MSRVLVVDDDAPLRTSLRRALAYEGYTVREAEDGQDALRDALSHPPDLVVLDLMMPGIDGIEVCRRLREGSDVPVLMLTARDEVQDRVAGLDSGANDYLCKPFALEELLARVRALLRGRNGNRGGGRLRYGDLTMDERTREVRRGERRIDLSPREYELLHHLLEHAAEVVDRRRVLDVIWRYPQTSSVLEVYIGYLRAKLEADGEPRLIQTVRGVGYMLRSES